MLEENYDEFYDIVEDILKNDEFAKLQNYQHHGLRRYDHCIRVARISYEITKYFHLDYEHVARGALLHDFFLEEKQDTKRNQKLKLLFNHPEYALDNSKKYFNLTDLEEDIIKTHMFPIGFKMPKYLESWIVDLVDDVVAIYEKCYGIHKRISFATSFLFFVFINRLK